MASDGLRMGSGNKGLTVKINLFSMEKELDTFNSDFARLWMKGTATNADTKEQHTFNDAGGLVTILGKWNIAKYKELKAKAPVTKRGGR